ncbi:hypothetical protein ACO0LF_03650 [Undibacterium sp. Di27W]|uniref:hypothetical protein n=1 Tax=Undibacterium sp. Di27W TaxID=3413036 RepID=UPI003BF3C1B8
MAKHAGPRPGSAAYKAICRIVDLGGSAKMSALLGVLPIEYHTVAMFRRYVIHILVDHALIFADMCDGQILRATQYGKDFAGRAVKSQLPTADKYVGEVVQPRTRTVRELNLKRHRAVAPFRPGSDDFKKIPSLFTADVVEKLEPNEFGALIRTVTVGKTVRKLPSGEVVE